MRAEATRLLDAAVSGPLREMVQLEMDGGSDGRSDGGSDGGGADTAQGLAET
jgi:hypothetical protein